jgi:hypothetical protein
MRLLALTALFLCLFPATSRAGGGLTAASDSCKCKPTRSDPLEEPVRFAFGKFSGQCVDSCRFRRARVLNDSGKELEVGNILHLGHYFSAKIRLDQVVNVEAGFERFAPGVDHVLLKFNLKSDVALHSQDGEVGDSPAATRAIVISSEGVPPKGTHYSLTDGYLGRYLLAHRVVTGEELDHWVAKLKHPLRMVPLELAGERAGNVLVHGLRRSEAESFTSAYQLFANNCSTAALSLLDAETHFHSTNWDPIHWEEFEAALPIAGPIGTEHALGYRGLTKP